MIGVSFSGRLVPGKGEGAYFTQADWAREAFIRLAGIDPWPGTLNLKLGDAGDLAAWRRLRAEGGLLMSAPDPAWCDGRCFPVEVERRFRAAIVVPEVADYPEDVVEIVAEVELRAALGLADGDLVGLSTVAAPAIGPGGGRM